MGLLSYFGIKIKPKPKNKTTKEEIQARNKPNMHKIVKVLVGIIIPLIVGAILFALLTI